MKAQLSLGFPAEEQGRRVWDAELEWVRRAVTDIGAKNVVDALDIKPSTLSDALAERQMPDGNVKALKAEWVSVIRHMASPALRDEYLSLICGAVGREVKVIRTRTPAEENAEMLAWLERKAGFVLEQMRKEIG